ncbi:hypothetical protein [Nocardiopsis salina]|uniref:hypothetical protein n=1 Tax=Nocardiopsis salina TaxID=245836 RepID=UPI000477AF32|nr:hypothetical protein [Nocardiopsis salina]
MTCTESSWGGGIHAGHDRSHLPGPGCHRAGADRAREDTSTLHFPADYGDGISDVEVTVVIDHGHDQDRADPYYGHMRTVYSATAQPLDADGAPAGEPVPPFDLVLEEPQPSPSPSPTPDPEPTPESVADGLA